MRAVRTRSMILQQFDYISRNFEGFLPRETGSDLAPLHPRPAAPFVPHYSARCSWSDPAIPAGGFHPAVHKFSGRKILIRLKGFSRWLLREINNFYGISFGCHLRRMSPVSNDLPQRGGASGLSYAGALRRCRSGEEGSECLLREELDLHGPGC